jgi:hypothetical protein
LAAFVYHDSEAFAVLTANIPDSLIVLGASLIEVLDTGAAFASG